MIRFGFLLVSTAMLPLTAVAQVTDPLAGIKPGLLKQPVVLSRPSEPKATYTLVQVTKNAQGQAVSVNTRYSDAAGWTFTQRVYDCKSGRVRTLGDGETYQQMRLSKNGSPFTSIVPGSSAADVGMVACEIIGGHLSL